MTKPNFRALTRNKKLASSILETHTILHIITKHDPSAEVKQRMSKKAKIKKTAVSHVPPIPKLVATACGEKHVEQDDINFQVQTWMERAETRKK